MSAVILDGKVLAAKLKAGLAAEIAALKKKSGQDIRVVSIMVGDEASARSYTLSQQKTAEAMGIDYELRSLSAESSQTQVLRHIVALNKRKDVHGIILTKPLPASIDFDRCADAIDDHKDIEGMNTVNLGRVLLGRAHLWPCTAAAALAHIKSTGIDLKGKEAVVLGRSGIVGKPVAFLLLQENATVTICHSGTKNLEEHVGKADIVVAAVGKPLFVKGGWVKPGAIVIDVGINQVDGKIVGDVDLNSAKEKAGYITPVPGGVGPVTSVMLMNNVVQAFKAQIN